MEAKKPKGDVAAAQAKSHPDISTDVNAQTKDPKSFEELGLAAELVEACGELGWKTPTEIQKETIPLGIEGGV